MSWINIISHNDATEPLKSIYNDIVKKRGGLANVIMVHSVNPAVMQAHMQLYISLMFTKSPLSRKEREMIATVVSSINKVDYCKTHHGESHSRLSKNCALTEQLRQDWKSATLTDREKAICTYAEKLTLFPSDINETDVETLRNAGFDDRAIHDIATITAYFCFVNRTVLGLGVTLEDDYEKTC